MTYLSKIVVVRLLVKQPSPVLEQDKSDLLSITIIVWGLHNNVERSALSWKVKNFTGGLHDNVIHSACVGKSKTPLGEGWGSIRPCTSLYPVLESQKLHWGVSDKVIQ